MELRAKVNGIWKDVTFQQIVELRKQEDRAFEVSVLQAYRDRSGHQHPAHSENNSNQADDAE